MQFDYPIMDNMKFQHDFVENGMVALIDLMLVLCLMIKIFMLHVMVQDSTQHVTIIF